LAGSRSWAYVDAPLALISPPGERGGRQSFGDVVLWPAARKLLRPASTQPIPDDAPVRNPAQAVAPGHPVAGTDAQRLPPPAA